MAEEDRTRGEDIVLIDEKKRKKRLPMWIAAIAVIEIVAAIALVKILAPGESPGGDDWEASATMVGRDVPDVVTNLRDEGAKRILRVRLSLRALAERPDAASAALNRPGVIEDRILAHLGQKYLADVQGRQEQIKQEILTILNRDLLDEEWQKENGRARVVELLMPAFIIQ
jgi:flagellar basal body-associated protein FliL